VSRRFVPGVLSFPPSFSTARRLLADLIFLPSDGRSFGTMHKKTVFPPSRLPFFSFPHPAGRIQKPQSLLYVWACACQASRVIFPQIDFLFLQFRSAPSPPPPPFAPPSCLRSLSGSLKTSRYEGPLVRENADDGATFFGDGADLPPPFGDPAHLLLFFLNILSPRY